LGLIDRVKTLDHFLNESHLEKEFTRERFDYNGIDYDGKSIHKESYIQTYKAHSSSEEIIEVEMIFEEYQIAAFKTALNIIKNGFVEEYISSYIPLVEKIAFGNSLRRHLQSKLEIFRNNESGRRFAGLLSDFIEELSIEFIDSDASTAKNYNSFKYSDKFFHRQTTSKLYKVLIEHNLIGGETMESDFNRIFQNLEIDHPVRWTGQTSELKYFINLINRSDLYFEDRGDYKWRIAVKCFVKVSSRSLKKITYKDLRTYKVTPKSKQKLDNILVNRILNF